MMVGQTQQPQLSPRRRAWRRLRLWQRVVLIGVVLGALVIGAALVYFEPGARSFTSTGTPAPIVTTTEGPLYPPGTRYYYRRSQWLPLDQQEQAQP